MPIAEPARLVITGVYYCCDYCLTISAGVLVFYEVAVDLMALLPLFKNALALSWRYFFLSAYS